MKKMAVKLDLHDDKGKQKAMKKISGLSGIASIAMDMDKKLTVTGDIDPVTVVAKLRKLCHTEVLTVEPAKEPEKKKVEPKKDKPKKQMVVKLDLHDDKGKQKAMQTISGLSGIDSIAMDMDKKLTVTGDIDLVTVGTKLRKVCHAEILTFGPAKEPEKKKDEPKKDNPKKADEEKKDEPKKDKPKKADEEKKDESKKDKPKKADEQKKDEPKKDKPKKADEKKKDGK